MKEKDKTQKKKPQKAIIYADNNTKVIDGNGKIILLKRFAKIITTDNLLIQNARENKYLKVEVTHE